MIAALKFEDFGIQYQLFKVLASAKFAIFVFAIRQFKEFFLWVFLVADQTGLICSELRWLCFTGQFKVIRYLNASFPNKLLLLHQVDLIYYVFFIDIMCIVFESNLSFTLVILMSKMWLNTFQTKKAEIALPLDKIVHEKSILLPRQVLNYLFEIRVLYLCSRILHYFRIETHHYHCFYHFISLTIYCWTDTWGFLRQYRHLLDSFLKPLFIFFLRILS
jgi:hypothetical protein